jgi:hypothetical protein
MSRRLIALLGATCLLLLGLGSAIAMGNGDDDDHDGAALFAELNGRNEISPTGQRGAGDPDGFGSASFTFDGGEVCFGITVANIATPTGAHIHRGRENENGPIVVALTQPTAGDPGASSGCVAIDDALARDIQRHPKRFYANVHTGDFAAGAVRGQLQELDDD